ncbi:MAG: thermonuclease family protein [archaeon]
MNRIRSFVVSLIFILAFISIYNYFHTPAEERENVTISRVIDGDTIVLNDSRHVRLLNINTPEKGTPHAVESKSFLQKYEGKSISMDVQGTDKYDRTLARLYAPEYLNLKMVELGLAPKFLVDASELKLFSKAEETAIANALGIWVKSEYSNCLQGKVNQKDELVKIELSCNISTRNFTIKDESRKTYILPDMTNSFILHTFTGEDNATDLFWNSNTDIWNNDRDTLYIFDRNGSLISFYSYGY